MGEAGGEPTEEAFCFCCSMSSRSRPLAAALLLFSSRSRCSTEGLGEQACTHGTAPRSGPKCESGAPFWSHHSTTGMMDSTVLRMQKVYLIF